MKVLIANTRHYIGGGDSSYTFTLAGALRQHGHDVAFFAMADERNHADENADLFVSHIDFRELNRRKSVSSGVRVLSRSVFSREAAGKFAALIDRVQPDVIHLQNIHAHLTPSIIGVADARGIPTVWTMHDYKVMCPNSHFRVDATGEVCEQCRPGHYHPAILRRCKKGSLLASTASAIEAYAHWFTAAYRPVKRFIAPSRFLADKLIAHGWSQERVSHVRNPISSDVMTGDRSSNTSGFLFVGKLEELKGVPVLLDAAAAMPHATFSLVGACEDTALLARIDALPNVNHLGVQPPEAVRRLMAASRAVVVPSVWYENQPMVILEAFATGVPVIGSRIGGIPELVIPGETGLLVEPGNHIELAAAVRALEDDPQMAAAMGAHARQYVLRQHSLEQHAEAITAIYECSIAAASLN